MSCVTPAALGAPVAALVQRCGVPARVDSDSRGNHFLFADDNGAVTSDAVVDSDDGIVHAIELDGAAPGSLTTDVGGTARTFTLGKTMLQQNDAVLADAAQYTFGTTRIYGTDPKRLLVLVFDKDTRRLTTIAIGETPTLSRLGLASQAIGDSDNFGYARPVLQHGAALADRGAHATIVRLDIDTNGIVRNVAIVIPSADAAFDAALAAKLGDDRYAPAMLNGRPIGGSVYREIRH